MPYDRELASSYGYSALLNSEFIKKRLATFVSSAGYPEDSVSDLLKVVSADELSTISGVNIEHVVSIDGSVLPVENKRPLIELGFIKVAVVLENLNKLKVLNNSPMSPTPSQVRDCYKTYTIETVLPGRGVEDKTTHAASRNKFRLEVFESCRSLLVDPNPLFRGGADYSLMDALGEIVQDPTGYGTFIIKCSNQACRSDNAIATRVNCERCGEHLYPTDFLRLHQKFSNSGSNEKEFNEAMSTMERIVMAGLILKASHNPESLKRVLFITDGPLAFFRAGELSEHMTNFLQRQKNQPVLMGIEKTGRVADFANSDTVQKKLNPGDVAMLTSDAFRLLADASTSSYGHESFYGRRFIYRTRSGHKTFVLSVPPSSGIAYGIDSSEEWTDYPTLKHLIDVIEETKIDLYGTSTPAISSISKANDTASIPRSLGEKMLSEIIGDLVNPT